MRSCFFYSCRDFFFALIAIANYRKDHKRRQKTAAKRHIRNFHKYVHGGAINLVHKLQLLEAELLSLTCTFKNFNSVLQKYNDAIAFATRTGFLQDAALANYLCFEFCKHSNKNYMEEELYLKNSLELWIRWGAFAVAKSLAVRHPQRCTSDSVRESLETHPKSGQTTYRSRARFDANDSEQHKTIRVPL